MIYAAEKLSEAYECALCGFDTADMRLPAENTDFPAKKYDIAVLPLPASPDGINIRCPLSGRSFGFDMLAYCVKPGGIVFTGKLYPELENVCERIGAELCDYFGREELAVLNAVPTAEGAVAAAVNAVPISIHGADVLICGFGRIGKLTARYFSAMGASVSVSARKYSDLAWIRALGYKGVDIREPGELESAAGKADIILNTVPAPVFDRKKLLSFKKSAVLIELASSPCVPEEAFAESIGIKIIKAGGLPGKTAPVTAGFIIAETIENILMERSLSHD